MVFWYNKEIYLTKHKDYMRSTSQRDGTTSIMQIPTVLSPEAVYDLLMNEIEPELVSTNVNGLKEKYRNEKPEQARKRAKRYALAFEEYDRRLDLYINKLNKAMNAYARDAAKSLEAYEQKNNTDNLADLESQISSTL